MSLFDSSLWPSDNDCVTIHHHGMLTSRNLPLSEAEPKPSRRGRISNATTNDDLHATDRIRSADDTRCHMHGSKRHYGPCYCGYANKMRKVANGMNTKG
jgi:hypothetical protein